MSIKYNYVSINIGYLSIKKGLLSSQLGAASRQSAAKNYENTPGGVQGGAEPPPCNCLCGNFIFFAYSLNDVVIKAKYGCGQQKELGAHHQHASGYVVFLAYE